MIERVNGDGHTVICKAMFKKETDISLFTGMKVGCCVAISLCFFMRNDVIFMQEHVSMNQLFVSDEIWPFHLNHILTLQGDCPVLGPTWVN